MSDLIVIDGNKLPELFTETGIDKLLSDLKSEITPDVFDVTTDKGRKDLASRARKVSSFKVKIDNLGKDLVAEEKKKLALVDKSRKKFREECDKIRDSVRLPLTEYEAIRKEVDNKIRWMEDLSSPLGQVSSEELKAQIAEIESIDSADIVADKRMEFCEARTEALKNINIILESQLKFETDQKELEELRAMKAAQEAKEAEEEIKRQAKEQAEKEAEEKIKAAEEKIKKDADFQERLRIKAEEEQRRIEKLKAENKEHQKAVNNKALECLTKDGFLSEEVAKELIKKIAKGEIENVTINY